MIPDAHGTEPPGDRMTIARVTVPDEVIWRFTPREGVGDLVSDPLSRWVDCYTKRYQPPAFVPENDQHVQQPEPDRRHDQEVHGADAGRVIVRSEQPGVGTGDDIRDRRLSKTQKTDGHGTSPIHR